MFQRHNPRLGHDQSGPWEKRQCCEAAAAAAVRACKDPSYIKAHCLHEALPSHQTPRKLPLEQPLNLALKTLLFNTIFQIYLKMHAQQLLAVAFAALCPAVFAADYDVQCETSGASPWSEDITGLINEVKGWDSDRGKGYCQNHNVVESKCENKASHYSATLAVCNSIDMLSCTAAADIMNAIQQQCKDTVDGHERAGGSGTLNGITVEIVHS